MSVTINTSKWSVILLTSSALIPSSLDVLRVKKVKSVYVTMVRWCSDAGLSARLISALITANLRGSEITGALFIEDADFHLLFRKHGARDWR